jgi:hypothetical protein
MKSIIAGALISSSMIASQAFAWNAPICFATTTKEVTLTLRELGSAAIGHDLQVKFTDNEGEVSSYAVKPSVKAGEYDVVLSHADPQATGIVGVELSDANGAATYELEFRDAVTHCVGAKISIR